MYTTILINYLKLFNISKLEYFIKLLFFFLCKYSWTCIRLKHVTIVLSLSISYYFHECSILRTWHINNCIIIKLRDVNINWIKASFLKRILAVRKKISWFGDRAASCFEPCTMKHSSNCVIVSCKDLGWLYVRNTPVG